MVSSSTRTGLSPWACKSRLPWPSHRCGKPCALSLLQLASLDYTTNADWYSVMQGSGAEAAMKAALHQGTLKDFNVYSAAPRASTGEPVAGFTDLPMFSKVPPLLQVSKPQV